jgi:hypothetical protein
MFLILFIAFPTITSAEGGKGKCSPLVDEDTNESIKKFQEDEADLGESYTIDFISSLWNIAGVNTLNNLVFGNPNCVWLDSDEEDLVLGLYTKDEKEKIIDPVVKMFSGAFVLFLTLSILVSTLKMGMRAITNSAKEEFYEDIQMWFLVGLFIASYWIIVQQILNINAGIVSGLRGLLDAYGIDYKSGRLLTSKDEFNFTDIIIFLSEWMITIFLNFVYIARKVMITLLLMLGLLAGISLLYKSTRFYFSTWIKELLGAVLLQSMHALLFTIFMFISSLAEGEGSVIIKMILLILFIPLSSMIFGWLNLSTGQVAHQMGMTGIQSLATASRVSRMVANKGRNSRMPNSKTADVGKTAISTRASGDNSTKWGKTKSALGTTGALLGGTAGLALGPSGVMIGSQMGGSLTKGVLQGTRNLSSGINSTRKTLTDAKKEHGSWKNATGHSLAERRQQYGKLGESVGSSFGLGAQGRKLGHVMSGVSRQRLLNSNEPGNLAGNSLHNLHAKHPEAKLNWVQTNEGSGFYMNNDGQMKLVSTMGPADSSLRDGESRMVDYSFANSSTLSNKGSEGYQPSGNLSTPQSSYPGNSSVPSLKATSSPYIKAGEHSYQDSRFNSSSVSPETYFNAGMPGAEMRSNSDRLADKVHSLQSFRDPNKQRHRGFS